MQRHDLLQYPSVEILKTKLTFVRIQSYKKGYNIIQFSLSDETVFFLHVSLACLHFSGVYSPILIILPFFCVQLFGFDLDVFWTLVPVSSYCFCFVI